MSNPWKKIETSQLYEALLSDTSEQALQKLAKAKQVMKLSANRARIKAGKRLMNEFHKRIIHFIDLIRDEEGENYVETLRQYPSITEEIVDDEFLSLIKDYMEYCYD